MQILAVHHIGIRVVDAARSIAFYERLGFRVVYRDGKAPVVILQNDCGVEVNLIVNASSNFDGNNPLMDVVEKLPGFTHVALRVASIDLAKVELEQWGIPITEGPVRLGNGLSLFFRDPDANVVELRQDLD